MGRPPEFNREKAVSAALDRLWRAGFNASTAHGLSEAMGLSRSSFYNSFGSREAVFLEAMEVYTKDSPDSKIFEIGEDDLVLPVIRDIVKEVCRVRSDPSMPGGCFAVNSIAELVGADDELGPMLESMLTLRIRTYAKLFGQARRNGEFERDIDEKLLAEETMVFLCGLNTTSKVMRNEKKLWALACSFMAKAGFPADVIEGN